MRRILVAGVGNVFFGDDGFGVAVAQRLTEWQLPAPAVVTDFGIRGIHLAYELLDPVDLLVVIDATRRGGEPGSLYLIDPDLGESATTADAHGMELPAVFAAVRAMGGRVPRTLLVGCEPRCCEGLGLSEPVRAAVEPAAEMVRDILARETSGSWTREGREAAS